jgi:hypothetical protein
MKDGIATNPAMMTTANAIAMIVVVSFAFIVLLGENAFLIIVPGYLVLSSPLNVNVEKMITKMVFFQNLVLGFIYHNVSIISQ